MQKNYNVNELEQTATWILNNSKSNIFLFYGNMGVGKTTLIKTLVKILGSEDVVSSPTFSLINEYRTKDNIPIYHFDFYRIENEIEAMDIGLEEYLDSGAYCFVEWAEKIENLLIYDSNKIYLFENKDGSRSIKIE